MAINTYVAIDTKIITSTVQAVTFTSIPQTYTDLVLIAAPKCDAQRDLEIRVGNGSVDTGSNYSTTAGWASTSTTGSNRNSSATYMYGNYYAGTTTTAGQNVRTYHFNNYSNTTTFKSMLARSSTASLGVDFLVGTWRSTSAINTISIFPLSGDIVAGSTFTLYGIQNSNIGAPKAFGGTITQDATYTYHTFGASGTFIPQQSLTADCLVIAGGGGGGNAGGGGGAGSLIHRTGFSLTATNYSITIGTGGAGDTTRTNAPAGSGTPSTFNGISATGGGGGTSNNGNNNGGAGGSGGGAVGTGAGGTASAGTLNGGTGYVNIGGGSVSGGNLGQGGGGAGGVGGTQNAPSGGLGGVGSSLFSSWLTATGMGQGGFIAGGGAGYSDLTNAGGLGGGGNSGIGTTDGASGLRNTGGGAGGSRNESTGNGGNGGSGVVIIRYLTA
jgi:hypothetical protein